MSKLVDHPAEPLAEATESGKEHCAAVVLGLDSHGLAVARALGIRGVAVYALEPDRSLPGVASRFVREVVHVNSFDSVYLVPALRELRRRLQRFQRVALLAVNDRQVEAIGRNIEALRGLYRIAWADCAETILELQRKDSLQRISSRQGLLYPRSVMFDATTTAQAAADFSFPVIIKPVRPLSSFKTLLARDVAELEQLLARYSADFPILGQEYVGGDDRQIYFGALMLDKGRVLHEMAGRKIASFPPARGQTIIAETVDQAEVLEQTRRFFAGSNLSGPASLEVKRDEQGRWWVIEPTIGRTDFWAELCIAAGFNQPMMEFQLACALPVDRPSAVTACNWYDTERAPLSYLRLCQAERSLRPGQRRQAFPYWGHHDLRPVVRASLNSLQTRWRRLFAG